MKENEKNVEIICISWRHVDLSYEGRSPGVSLGFQRKLYRYVKSSALISNIEKLAAETNPLKKFGIKIFFA